MFEDLFTFPKALARHRTGRSAEARERFLAHCAGYGAARSTLLRLANELLVVAERIDVDSGKRYLLADVETAADRWTRFQLRRRRARSKRWPRVHFIQVATAWLRFLGCLDRLAKIMTKLQQPSRDLVDKFSALWPRRSILPRRARGNQVIAACPNHRAVVLVLRQFCVVPT
jgi:integrase/recombinase XerD